MILDAINKCISYYDHYNRLGLYHTLRRLNEMLATRTMRMFMILRRNKAIAMTAKSDGEILSKRTIIISCILDFLFGLYSGLIAILALQIQFPTIGLFLGILSGLSSLYMCSVNYYAVLAALNQAPEKSTGKEHYIYKNNIYSNLFGLITVLLVCISTFSTFIISFTSYTQLSDSIHQFLPASFFTITGTILASSAAIAALTFSYKFCKTLWQKLRTKIMTRFEQAKINQPQKNLEFIGIISKILSLIGQLLINTIIYSSLLSPQFFIIGLIVTVCNLALNFSLYYISMKYAGKNETGTIPPNKPMAYLFLILASLFTIVSSANGFIQVYTQFYKFIGMAGWEIAFGAKVAIGASLGSAGLFSGLVYTYAHYKTIWQRLYYGISSPEPAHKGTLVPSKSYNPINKHVGTPEKSNRIEPQPKAIWQETKNNSNAGLNQFFKPNPSKKLKMADGPNKLMLSRWTAKHSISEIARYYENLKASHHKPRTPTLFSKMCNSFGAHCSNLLTTNRVRLTYAATNK